MDQSITMGLSLKARHKARMFAMQAMYQWQIAGGEPAAVQTQFMRDNSHHKVDWDFFKAITDESFSHRQEFDDMIQSAKSQDQTQVLPIERSIIWLGLAELQFHVDVPYKVVIKEYIILAQEFGAEDGYKFVNGVLDKLAAVLRNPLL